MLIAKSATSLDRLDVFSRSNDERLENGPCIARKHDGSFSFTNRHLGLKGGAVESSAHKTERGNDQVDRMNSPEDNKQQSSSGRRQFVIVLACDQDVVVDHFEATDWAPAIMEYAERIRQRSHGQPVSLREARRGELLANPGQRSTLGTN
jgi:hypothetical protein